MSAIVIRTSVHLEYVTEERPQSEVRVTNFFIYGKGKG